MHPLEKSCPRESDPEILKDRIRAIVDSADPAMAAALLMSPVFAESPLMPIAAIRGICSGSTFVERLLPYVPVTEVGDTFHINFKQFRAVNASIQLGANHKELLRVSQKYAPQIKSDVRYTKDKVTIQKIQSKGRYGKKWYLRIQTKTLGRPWIDLDYSRSKAHAKAVKIKKKVAAGFPLENVLKEVAPDSSFLHRLEMEFERKDATRRQNACAPKTGKSHSEVTIMDLILAYQEGAKNRTNGLNEKNARRCVNQLRKVITLGLNLKPPKDKTKKEVEAAEKRAFERPVSDLSPGIVDVFMDTMLGVGDDFDDIDEVEILERSESANSTFRQAKSIFSEKGRRIFRRAGLAFDLPAGFLSVGFLPVTHGIYTLPELDRIEGIFEELRVLLKTDPSHYLARLIALYVNLRPKEIIHLRKDQIKYSGYWRVEIRVRGDFKPKHYHERSIKISAGLAEHILDICRDNGSDYVISGDNRLELFRPFNSHLREKFLPEQRRPSYELRKFYASSSKLAVGLAITHQRMGHNNPSTTEKHYIDKDAPQELVDIYEKYAQELFGGAAFLK
ncbi:hypothetical protein DDZ13_02385 [Coraliomargarita sinensis]|uniref:Tyr recombinase domain-containing protein n=1 Tax=Coraliomargarita sinensis TaxID=2174842 RepID=A0A317ZPE5_9BACT|nr:hypothetical protein [Coraliomargarita sinensis]PXA05738.1 hypothetical protein DDZ13_02385 [Coraliomargarita sinensis]